MGPLFSLSFFLTQEVSRKAHILNFYGFQSGYFFYYQSQTKKQANNTKERFYSFGENFSMAKSF